ncbi:hypothetical protein P692DRAFT_20822860 [Suillus brevipes Sb2]|nr:hypothetical protein P692DRAFT_20822860 [Suillus brevipes Sb2]
MNVSARYQVPSQPPCPNATASLLQRVEQFIEAIHLVQSGHIPPSSSQPFGWPYRADSKECALHAQYADPRQDVTDSQGEDDTSIEDIWIGPADNTAEDDEPCSELEFHSSESEELEVAPSDTSTDASAETLVDIDPTSWFDWC